MGYLLCCEGSCWRSHSHRRVWEPSKGALGLGSWLLPPEAAAPSDSYHISGVRTSLPATRYKKQNRPLIRRANLAHKRRAAGAAAGPLSYIIPYLLVADSLAQQTRRRPQTDRTPVCKLISMQMRINILRS